MSARRACGQGCGDVSSGGPPSYIEEGWVKGGMGWRPDRRKAPGY